MPESDIKGLALTFAVNQWAQIGESQLVLEEVFIDVESKSMYSVISIENSSGKTYRKMYMGDIINVMCDAVEVEIKFVRPEMKRGIDEKKHLSATLLLNAPRVVPINSWNRAQKRVY